MTLPDFLGIGAHKAGSTWLFDMLAQNPSVWLPPLKEVHFFDRQNPTPAQKDNRASHILQAAERLERSGKIKGSTIDASGNVDFLRGLAADPNILSDEWYSSIFDHPDARGKITGEITPSYLDMEAGDIPKIAAMLPKAKFLLVVRDPLARSLSQLRVGAGRSGFAPETEAKWEFFIRRLGQMVRGNYLTSIPLWQSHFGPDRLLIRPFGMVKHEPAKLLREVEDFIGAAHFDGYKEMTEQIHKTKDVEVPDWVRDRLEEKTRPQRDYLIKAFGQEFYENTR